MEFNIKDFENFIYSCENIIKNADISITTAKEVWKNDSNYTIEVAHKSKTNIKHLYLSDNNKFHHEIRKELEKFKIKIESFNEQHRPFRDMQSNRWFVELWDLFFKYYDWFNELVDNTTQKNDTTLKSLLKNPHEKIFSNDLGYTLFISWHNLHKEDPNPLANYSFIYNALDKDKIIVCTQVDFVKLLSEDIYCIDIDKIDSRQTVKRNSKNRLYKAIKEQFTE